MPQEEHESFFKGCTSTVDNTFQGHENHMNAVILGFALKCFEYTDKSETHSTNT